MFLRRISPHLQQGQFEPKENRLSKRKTPGQPKCYDYKYVSFWMWTSSAAHWHSALQLGQGRLTAAPRLNAITLYFDPACCTRSLNLPNFGRLQHIGDKTKGTLIPNPMNYGQESLANTLHRIWFTKQGIATVLLWINIFPQSLCID